MKIVLGIITDTVISQYANVLQCYSKGKNKYIGLILIFYLNTVTFNRKNTKFTSCINTIPQHKAVTFESPIVFVGAGHKVHKHVFSTDITLSPTPGHGVELAIVRSKIAISINVH